MAGFPAAAAASSSATSRRKRRWAARSRSCATAIASRSTPWRVRSTVDVDAKELENRRAAWKAPEPVRHPRRAGQVCTFGQQRLEGRRHRSRFRCLIRFSRSIRNDDQDWRFDACRHLRLHDQGRPAEDVHRPALQGQDGRAVLGAGRLHAHLRCQAPAGLRAACGRHQGQRRRHHRLHGGQRRVRDGRLGQGRRMSATTC